MNVTQKEIVQRLRCAAAATNPYSYLFNLADEIEAHGIAPPDGYALVPIEPTAEMVEAYSRASEQLRKNHLLSGSYPAIWQPIKAGYKAMLTAAPKQEND